MSSSAPKSAPEALRPLDMDQLLAQRLQRDEWESRRRRIARIGHLWEQRNFLARCAAIGFAAFLILALIIPPEYTASTRLMPPDPAGGQGMALLAGIVGKLGAIGASGELLGITTSGELFAGVLQSNTVQNDLIQKFDLRRVYGRKRLVDTRKELSSQTDVSIDRKSGILTIRVTDHDPKRASAMAR